MDSWTNWLSLSNLSIHGWRRLFLQKIQLRSWEDPNSISTSFSPTMSPVSFFSFRLLLPSFAVLLFTHLLFVTSHEESGDWHCNPDSEARISAEFKPGIVTLDGRADDWNDIYGFEFPLLPALDPDQDKEYKGGKMMVKVDMLFLNLFVFVGKFKFLLFTCSFLWWISGFAWW